MHPLNAIFQHKLPGQTGIYSVCTANEFVLQAAMLHAKEHHYILAVEATANQVNQFGGYTGMQPKDYVDLVERIRNGVGLAKEQVILGGDHLGPLTWKELPEREPMERSVALVTAFTLAGFTKIHLDTSMRLADDDPDRPLDVRVCAHRCVVLAKAVMSAYEELHRSHPDALRPVLVVGSEVPIPGGSQEHEDTITPTSAEEFLHQYDVFKEVFEAEHAPFEDVVAFVVQPGVEFGDDFAVQYVPENAKALCGALKKLYPLVFEGHSTDYQTAESLRNMVRDGIQILKVGPALTFGLREALLALADCEEIMIADPNARSGVKNAIVQEMDADDRYWKSYYHGTPDEVAFKKIFSYSDRCRYYLPSSGVVCAIRKLLANTADVPVALISQYFPRQYEKVMRSELKTSGLALLLDRVGNWCDPYAAACGVLL